MTSSSLFRLAISSLIGFQAFFIAGCSGDASDSSSACTAVAGSQTQETLATTAVRVPLSGCTTIDYSLPATIGTTSGLNLLIDSGSTSLAVAGSSCSNCTSISPVYALGTNAIMTCSTDVQSGYGDGTGWDGPAVTDTVSIGSLPVAKTSFASITQQYYSNSTGSGFFSSSDCSMGNTGTNSSQGIIGFAGSDLALGGTTGYLDALNSQQSYPQFFATQLCGSGGNIWFGNWDPTYAVNGATPVYTPILVPNDFYYVNLKDMQVNGTSLGLTSGNFPKGTIVDTGTSVTIVSQTVFDAVVDAVAQNANFQSFLGHSGSAAYARNWFSSGSCVTSSSSDTTLNSDLPPLALVLQSTTSGQTINVSLPAIKSYLDRHRVGSQMYYCAGIIPDGDAGDPSILGGSFLRSQITLFDRNSGRIGFVPENSCTY